jgi:hypothetical protein
MKDYPPTRSVILGTLILLGMSSASVAALAEQLPVPPIPPDNLRFAETAPVPDPDAQAPVTAASDEPSVDVRLYRSNAYDPSLGFAPGSRFQTNEDRKPIQTPGFSISVPLK